MGDNLQLNPCPSCGSDNVRLEHEDNCYVYYYVKCNNCTAKGDSKMWEEDAVEAWNQKTKTKEKDV